MTSINSTPTAEPQSASSFMRVTGKLFKKQIYDPSFEERTSLGPWQKFIKYRKIPWKLLIHVTLAILLFTQALLFSYRRQHVRVQTLKAISERFMPEDFEVIERSLFGHPTAYFSTMESVFEDVNKTVQAYYAMPEKAADVFVFLPYFNGTDFLPEPLPVRIRGELFHTNLRDIIDVNNTKVNEFEQWPLEEFEDELTEAKPLGTYLLNLTQDATRQRAFFDRLKSFTLSLRIQKIDTSPIGAVNVVDCSHLAVDKEYSFLQRGGRLRSFLYLYFENCQNERVDAGSYFRRFVKPYTWISILIIILSNVSIFLTIKAIYHRMSLYEKVRVQDAKKDVIDYGRFNFVHKLKLLPFKRITLGDVPNILQFEFIFAGVCDALNILGSFLCIFFKVDLETAFVVGLGDLLFSIQVIKYFKYSPKFYLLIRTLQNSLPNFLRFIIGVFPIFMGFILFGTLVFGHYVDYFEDLDDSAVSLFSCMNGDALHETFDFLYGINWFVGWSGRLFLLSYTIMFVFSVLNVFIMMTESAFNKVRESEAKQQVIAIADMDADAVEDELDSDTQSVIIHADHQLDMHSDAWKQESVAENAQRLVTMCEETLQSNDNKDAQKQQYMQELQEHVKVLLQTLVSK